MSNLQEMRETWRPKLAHRVGWMVPAMVPVDLAVFLLRPESSEYAVALTVAVFGLAASLFGLRQWGKNAGVSDA